METFAWDWALGGVFLLGLQTSISPCPLTTNIAAISFIGGKAARSRDVVAAGILYISGQIFAYVALSAFLLQFSATSGDRWTRFFQSNVHLYLGPATVLLGMFFLGLVPISFRGFSTEKLRLWTRYFGVASAFPIGSVLALAFCPTSAATFLAMLALAARANSTILFPFFFGVGSALPVLLFAGILAFQSRRLARTFDVVRRIDFASRTLAGWTLILLGIWLSLRYVYELF